MEDMDGAPASWDGLPSLAEAGSSNFDRSFYSSPAHLPPSTSIARSSSHLSTNSEVHLPSDISSVASWDSLDSWEMERRMNYEEPTRRSDFRAPSTTPKGSRITQATVGASSPTSPITGDFVPSIIVTDEPVSKPTTAPTPVHVVESPPIGGTQISQPSTVGDPATPFPEDEEPIVFFPRPAGCEPGHGMARSPHLEGLSRFSGKSAIG
ncbi:hypothetical protein FRC02_004586 [Tulasnella sp. 418]|nr:hypothetical protein FRC02_004586 [Tulasnella sp. 418]